MKRFFFLSLLCTLLLSSCSLPGMPTITPTVPLFPPVASKVVPVKTLPPLPTFTQAALTPPALTATRAVDATKAPLPTLPAPTKAAPTLPAPTQPAPTQPPPTRPAPTLAPTTPPNAKEGKIFMIALGDNGAAGKKIGCGDSAVAVTVALSDPAAPLRSVLESLLAVNSQYYGQSGLYNTLFRSDLTLKMVTIKDGVADIRLTGSLTLGGVCDNPRVQAQLEETARQFSTVKQVNVFINDKSLAELLSLK